MNEKMEKFSSRITFLLALIGSAVGLGNIWRVSYLFSYHGFVFLLAYLFFVIIIGLPLIYLELKIAEYYKKNVKNLYEIFSKKHKIAFAKYLYLIPFIAIFIISIYYSIVLSEVANNIIDIHQGALFIIWAISLYAVLKGIKSLETINNIFIFILFINLLFLLLNVKTIPDLTSFKTDDIIEAIKQGLAHTMFSLSVGTGLLYTYAVYSKKSNNFENSLITAISDTCVAIIALIIIFSTFQEHKEGKLFIGFEGIKNKYYEIGQGHLSYLFFLSLFSAGLTSLIALLKFIYDNSNKYILVSAFLLSIIFSFLPHFTIEFLDSVIGTSLLIISFPLTILVFFSLLSDKKKKFKK